MSSQPRRPARLVVLVSGRGTNLQAIIEAIHDNQLHASIEAVISDRPSALALERATAHGLRAVALDYRAFSGSTEYNDVLLAQLSELNPDLIVLSGYMRILPAEIVRAFRWRVVNIHPSLLPAFPGLNPHKQALDYGVKFSGCTVHFVDEGMDTGPIIMQAVVPVHDGDTAETLAARVLTEEHRLYPQAIHRVLAGEVRVVGRRVVAS